MHHPRNSDEPASPSTAAHQYQNGDPIWAFLTGWPWWPARILPRAQIAVTSEKVPLPKKGHVFVEFFNWGKQFARVPLTRIRPYGAFNSEELNPGQIAKVLAAALRSAIAEADSYTRRTQISSQNEYLQTSISPGPEEVSQLPNSPALPITSAKASTAQGVKEGNANEYANPSKRRKLFQEDPSLSLNAIENELETREDDNVYDVRTTNLFDKGNALPTKVDNLPNKGNVTAAMRLTEECTPDQLKKRTPGSSTGSDNYDSKPKSELIALLRDRDHRLAAAESNVIQLRQKIEEKTKHLKEVRNTSKTIVSAARQLIQQVTAAENKRQVGH